MAGTTGISRKESADQTGKPGTPVGSPEPFESLPEPPGVPPVLNPATNTMSLDVETSFTKPLTRLYLVLDNSNSMTAIQSRMATTTEALLKRIAAENLNVDLYLYSTTDYRTYNSPNLDITSSFGNQSLYLPTSIYGFHGAQGNSLFANRKFFEYVGGVKKDLASYTDRTGSSFWVSDDVVLGKSMFQTSDGVVKFRENMGQTAADSLAASAANAIRAHGIAGSDVEVPIGTVYRISRSIAASNNERAAFAIITNEDDDTRKNTMLRNEVEFTSGSSITFSGSTEVTYLYLEYEYLAAAEYRDGVLIKAAEWRRTSFFDAQKNCATNSLCNSTSDLNSNKSCTTAQLARARAALAPNLGATAREVSGASCTASHSTTTIESLSSNDAAETCDSMYSNTGKSYKDYFISRHPNERFASPACVRNSFGGFSSSSYKAVGEVLNSNIAENGSDAIGDLAIRNLSSVFGPKGYSVTLIANDGVNSCGQSNFSKAVRLESFLAKAPAPNVKISVCADDYSPVSSRLRDFIASAPKLIYEFTGDSKRVVKINATDNLGVVRELLKTDYRFESGTIIFKSGVIQIGDKLSFVLLK